MGLLQSKNACRRRESPEGGTLATGSPLLQDESAPTSPNKQMHFKGQGEEEERVPQPLSRVSVMEKKPGIDYVLDSPVLSSAHVPARKTDRPAKLGYFLTASSTPVYSVQDVCGVEPRDDHFLDHDCPLEVILPPERAAECQSYKILSENGDLPRRNAKSNDMECNMPVTDENHQEWVFTLYDFDNSGRVTKEDMSSLMHTIYEVVDASVKQSALCDTKTLRVKLTVTPLISNKRERDTGPPQNEQERLEENQPILIRRQSTDFTGSSEKKPYRIDENTERRNHYLDLAGIENYTSRFDADTLQSPSEEQCQNSPAHGTRFAHHRLPQLNRGSLGKAGGHRLPFLRSLRSRSKSNRLHGHHPVSWCCPPAPQQQHPLHYSHSKRAHARPRDATSVSVPHPGVDLDLQPGTSTNPVGFMPMPQRHEHHHLHEHHHHHHHHHHYYSS